MTRLTRLDNDNYRWLADDDHCYHYGEYTSRGGFKQSVTNQQIWNLKNKPTSGQWPLYYKAQAIEYWGSMMAQSLNLDNIVKNTTFIPIPCSKPLGHPDFDDRMLKVLKCLLRKNANTDIRSILMQTQLRTSQHESGRKSPAELLETLSIDRSQLALPVRSTIVIVDDVITQGASFNAAKSLVRQIPGVSQIIGVFLAKTVWLPDELDEYLAL